MAVSDTYLKTRQVADALGVSVSTVKRWVDAGEMDATRTLGKHRLVLLSSALRFARREHFPVDPLLELAERPGPVSTGAGGTLEALVEALKLGRSREASTLLALAYQSGGAVALADQVIRPVMERIGHGWLVGALDIYQEHQATLMVASALSELIGRVIKETPADVPRPLALGASPEGDPYTLPGLLGELVLREGGWDVRNLGPNLPLRSLAAATRHYRPGLVFLSAGMIADQAKYLQEYSYFYEAATQVGAAVILGGRALDPDLRSKLVYASFGDRMAHLAEFARMWFPSASAAIPSTPEISEATSIKNPTGIGTSDADDMAK